MNFKDAALKILDDNKKPLHYKKIANIAIKDKLVEHPGSNPTKRMFDVLKLESKKKDKIILSYGPGFFILKKYFSKKKKKTNIEIKLKRKKQEILEEPNNNAIINSEIQTKKEDSKNDKITKDNLEEITKYSKQIYSSRYFDNDAKEKKVQKKKDISLFPLELLNYMIEKKEIRYYNLEEIKRISIKLNFKDCDPSKISNVLYKFNKDKNNSYPFYFFENKLIANKLLHSENFLNNSLELSKLIANHNQLLNKEISSWIYKLSYFAFVEIVKTILEKINLNSFKKIDDFANYYSAYMDMGLSKIKFIIKIKKDKKPITNNDILEMRGLLPRFNAANSIFITSSTFKNDAIEEANIDSNFSLVLIDKHFIIKKMIEYKIGLFEKKNDILMIDHNFFIKLNK